MNKKERGITLIALVITIIVLVLLAGISISMLSGQDGILTKASQAKQSASEAEEYDKMALAVQEALVNGMGKIDLTEGSNQGNSLEKALKETFGEDKMPNYEAGKIILSNGEIYNITISGHIEKESEAKWIWTDNQEEGSEGHGIISVGDLITYKEKTTEQFYVIKVDEDNVAMLAAKNITTTGILEQSDSAPIVEFSNTNYWSSETSYPLDLNDYTDKTDAEKNSMGVILTDAIEIARTYGVSLEAKGRLMTLEEVIAIGGDITEDLEHDIYPSTSDCPTFVNTQSYYLGSAESKESLWVVFGPGPILGRASRWEPYGSFGLRPVIEVPIASIK